jgi:1-phosphatidylinositol phosphodiesterase
MNVVRKSLLIHGLRRVCILLCLIMLQPALGHGNAGYSHNADNGAHNNEWMASIPDLVRLSELSLPGTHDTMSFYGGDAVQTQSMPLVIQLKTGLRVLDIRTRHVKDSFAIHHGVIFQHVYFGRGVLEPVIAFLEHHPRETVLMRVKEEHTPADNTRTFGETFDWYLNTYGGWKHIWKPTSSNPTLGEVRGKIVILPQGFGSEYGLAYSNFDKQDDYKLTTNWDLYAKWQKVKAQLVKANKAKGSGEYFINYLSGSTGSFPYFVASGHSSPGTSAPRLATGLTTPGWNSSYPNFPRTSCFIGICTISFEGTNVLTYEYIKRGNVKYTGIVMADFPGSGLINEIIALNFK